MMAAFTIAALGQSTSAPYRAHCAGAKARPPNRSSRLVRARERDHCSQATLPQAARIPRSADGVRLSKESRSVLHRGVQATVAGRGVKLSVLSATPRWCPRPLSDSFSGRGRPSPCETRAPPSRGRMAPHMPLVGERGRRVLSTSVCARDRKSSMALQRHSWDSRPQEQGLPDGLGDRVWV